MADTVAVKWLYPPNFAGLYETENSGHKRHIIHMTGVSDGTGETGVVKVNRSELQGITGAVPAKLVVERIRFQIHGMNVLLEWDGMPNETIVAIGAGVTASSTSGRMEFGPGGLVPDVEGGTGDIKLTSSNCASGDSYDLTVTVRLKE